MLHLSVWQRFRLIEFPAALPEIFVGLRVGAVQAVVGAILAVDGWKQGLGYLMTFASATYKTPLLFATVIVTALLGIAVYQLIETSRAPIALVARAAMTEPRSRSAAFPWLNGQPTHLPCGPGDVTPSVLLPGDPTGSPRPLGCSTKLWTLADVESFRWRVATGGKLP